MKIVNFILKEDVLKGSEERSPRDRESDSRGDAMDLIIEDDQIL